MSIHSQDILRINCLFPGIPGRLAIGVREIKCVKYKIEGMEQLKIGGHKVPYERENDSFYVYCEDRRSVFTALYCHIHEIFNVNPDYLYIEPPFLWILNLSSRTTALLIIDQDKVDKVSISEEECKYVLKNCKTQDLLIYVDFPRHFRYFGSFGNYKKVYIRDGSWVMLENLISIGRSSTHIKMENTILTTKDINSFLKYWYSQTVNRFRRLTLNNDTNHLSSLFDGLEHTMRMVDGTMLHEWYYKFYLFLMNVAHYKSDFQRWVYSQTRFWLPCNLTKGWNGRYSWF
uniref:FBA_2 domain-containing protein n=1 Tax=Caenorhabditis tropicalis TaxID=1561998 RepID=A0A1I7V1V9_9PELO